MAVIFMDTFSHYLTGGILTKWGSLSGTPTIIDTNALHPGAGRCLFMQGNATTYNVTTRAFTPKATVIVGAYFQFTMVTDTSRPFLLLMDGATVHLDLRFDASGRIVITRNAAVLATSTTIMTPNSWHHIEVKATIGDAADTPSGRYEVRVNGTATGWIADSGAGQDTRNAGNASVSAVRLQQGNGFGVTAAGLWILDTTGSVANDFIGPKRVVVRRAVGVGAHSQWTPNYAANFANVQDEVGDGDTTFNQSNTPNQFDTYPMTEIPAGATVLGIQHCILARQDAGSQRSISAVDRLGGVDYPAAATNTGASYSYHLTPETLSPATGVAFTAAELNGGEGGVKLTA